LPIRGVKGSPLCSPSIALCRVVLKEVQITQASLELPPADGDASSRIGIGHGAALSQLARPTSSLKSNDSVHELRARPVSKYHIQHKIVETIAKNKGIDKENEGGSLMSYIYEAEANPQTQPWQESTPRCRGSSQLLFERIRVSVPQIARIAIHVRMGSHALSKPLYISPNTTSGGN
jgi:hypothetical protein